MASLGDSRSGGRCLGLLIWLVFLQPRFREARAGGEGAQGGSALPSPSPTYSVGGLEDPGASRWKPPPAGVAGPSAAPESRVIAVSHLVAFTAGDSDSYKAWAAPQTPAAATAAGTPQVSSGDVSGPGPATENWPGLRALGPCLGGGGPQGDTSFSWGGGSEWTQPCP